MSTWIPGEVITQEGEIMLNEGRDGRTVRVTNSADRPIQVGSHFHFFEVNRALRFDRSAAYGCRLDIPAGTAVRFEPGEEREVALVPLGGWHVVFGMNGLVNGSLDGEGAREAALDRARQQGFVDDEPQGQP